MVMWPFSRIWPGGIAHNAVPTAANLNDLDERVAQAADGATWSDIAAAANLVYLTGGGTANDIHLAVWRAVSGEWYVASGGNPPAIKRASAPYVWGESFESLSVPLGNGFANGQVNIFACNPAGIMLAGGAANTGTTQKLRRSVDGTNWTVEDTVGSTAIKSAAWFPAAGLWVAGYGVGATSIDTSPTGISGSWTARSVPNTHERGAIAVSPSRLVWSPGREGAFVARDKLLTSDDGIVYVERTIPSDVYVGVTYSTSLAKFFLASYGGTVRSSSDGVTWSTAGTVNLANTNTIVSYGRAVYVVGQGYSDSASEVWCSLDAGVSWRLISRWKFGTQQPDFATVGPGGQLYVASRLEGRARFGFRLGG